MSGPVLAIITTVRSRLEGDMLTLDGKALSGMYEYARHWPGRVRWLSTLTDEPIAYSERVARQDQPFEFFPIAADRSDAGPLLEDADIVLASGDIPEDFCLVEAAPGKVVFIIEYTLQTRLQILRLNKLPLHRFLRSMHWNLMTEWRRRRAFRRALGLQANGVPAFERYRSLNRATLLFLDTRLDADLQIDDAELDAKVASISSSPLLRLGYSGRLNRMKGAHFLIPLAQLLRERGIAFQLEIFGDGEERPHIAADIASNALEEHVRINGPVAFAEELVPAMKRDCHLFLCLHPQGDPACTYLETLGCGVPIVGFANEALVGMLRSESWGLTRPIGDIEGIADDIEALYRDRPRLARMAEAAVAFSRPRAASAVFAERAAHLRKLAGVESHATDIVPSVPSSMVAALTQNSASKM